MAEEHTAASESAAGAAALPAAAAGFLGADAFDPDAADDEEDEDADADDEAADDLTSLASAARDAAGAAAVRSMPAHTADTGVSVKAMVGRARGPASDAAVRALGKCCMWSTQRHRCGTVARVFSSNAATARCTPAYTAKSAAVAV